MIDEEATYNEFGYYSTDLTLRSDKRIIVACDKCGKIRKLRKADYRGLCRCCIQKGKKRSSATRRKMGIAKKRETLSSETRKKKSEVQRGSKNHNWQGGLKKRICVVCGKEFYVKRCKVKKGYGKYCSISCSSKVNIRKVLFHTCYTKPELKFEEICRKYDLPFKYTGDGTFWIHNINPDFIETNGKKLVVEVFGDYWHSPLLNRNLKEDRTLTYRKKILKKYGYKLIVFWETDLLRKDAEAFVLNSLKPFISSLAATNKRFK